MLQHNTLLFSYTKQYLSILVYVYNPPIHHSPMIHTISLYLLLYTFEYLILDGDCMFLLSLLTNFMLSAALLVEYVLLNILGYVSHSYVVLTSDYIIFVCMSLVMVYSVPYLYFLTAMSLTSAASYS